MRLFRTVLLFAAAFGLSINAAPAEAKFHSLNIFDAQSTEIRADISHNLEKRIAPQLVSAALRTWFKIGRTILKSYQEAVDGFDADGAGFHRDFADLVESELPEPPQGTSFDVPPN